MSAEYPSKEDLEARRESGDPVARTTRSGRARPIVTGAMDTRVGDTPTAPKEKRLMSAAVMRLAARLGVPASNLAERYPEDTLRRSKYPMIEEVQKDGSIVYKERIVK